MKILQLKWKNLNSLYGEWSIDFTADDYLTDGLFALIGPTGAGKSTVLDAICLALYGATPRLGRITKSDNQIMSRHRGECYAEVLFRSQAGTFCCHWQQRRAHRKAGKALQEPEHQIVDAAGTPLETKRMQVVKCVEEKTGMDFDRFTRSILLAQGRFDNFLRASVEEKSKILEQLTGTSIYSEISCLVHQRRQDEQQRLDVLKEKRSGLPLLSDEDKQSVEQQLRDAQQQYARAEQQGADIRQALTWRGQLAALEQDIQQLTAEGEALAQQQQSFAPARVALERATVAASLEGQYAELTSARRQQQQDAQELDALRQQLPQLKEQLSQQVARLGQAEEQRAKAHAAMGEAQPLFQQVRLLDHQLHTQRKHLTELADDEKKIQADIKRKEDELARKQESGRRHGQHLAKAADYLEQHSADRWLVAGFAGVEAQLRHHGKNEQQLAEKKRALDRAERELERRQHARQQADQRQQDEEKKLKHATNRLSKKQQEREQLLGGRSIGDYQREKEALLRERALLLTIAKLEDHRRRLKDGAPCPLCGAVEHPYALGKAPQLDQVDINIAAVNQLLTTAEEWQTQLTSLQKAQQEAQLQLALSEQQQAVAAEKQQHQTEQLRQAKEEVTHLQHELSEQWQQLIGQLYQLGPLPDTPSLLQARLRQRLADWQENSLQHQQLTLQRETLRAEIEQVHAVLQSHRQILAQQQSRLSQQQQQQRELARRREELFGAKKVEAEEARLQQALTLTEDEEKKARTCHGQLLQRQQVTETNIEALAQRVKRQAAGLEQQEEGFVRALVKQDFADEQQFRAARLASAERQRLADQAKQLDHQHTSLNARLADRRTSLERERAKEISPLSWEQLAAQQQEVEAKATAQREIVASLQARIAQHETALQQARNYQQALEEQQRELNHWLKLHELIGSADGKKYRNFAQGLTFELMVGHANQQLRQMSDRYLLVRDRSQPLELNVVDQYQAEEVRSVKNLSGGESFIVSLSLALGLSNMASRRIRVDSLFLDEGFGTLDEDALSTALDALAVLQQKGKLVGVISHITALKERIGTQITVSPVVGGRSTLTGPGCEQINR